MEVTNKGVLLSCLVFIEECLMIAKCVIQMADGQMDELYVKDVNSLEESHEKALQIIKEKGLQALVVGIELCD